MLSWLIAIVIPLAVGGAGGVATAKSIPTWYAELRKPTWNPPNRVFGPVWTTLYLLMGTASWLVWRRVGFGQWLAPYGIQLALNLLWSFLFFAWRRPGWAFAEILLLAGSIAWTVATFAPISPLAAGLFAPYLLWVSFASALNGAVWRLNA